MARHIHRTRRLGRFAVAALAAAGVFVVGDGLGCHARAQDPRVEALRKEIAAQRSIAQKYAEENQRLKAMMGFSPAKSFDDVKKAFDKKEWGIKV